MPGCLSTKKPVRFPCGCEYRRIGPEGSLAAQDRQGDFGFIREKVRNFYYADNCRPAIDPVVLFRVLFIGNLLGVCTEHQQVRDIQVNVSISGFCGLLGDIMQFIVSLGNRTYLCSDHVGKDGKCCKESVIACRKPHLRRPPQAVLPPRPIW
jgi:hypothetical protein